VRGASGPVPGPRRAPAATPGQPPAEIARVAGVATAAGSTIGRSAAGHQLDDPVLHPVLAELDRRRAVAFLHPAGQEDTGWPAGHNLAWLAGAPSEDTAAALRPVLAGVPARHPGPRLIIPHPGGTIPLLAARVTRKSAGEIPEGLRGLYHDTVSGSPEALPSARRISGAGQDPARHRLPLLR